MPLLDPVAFAQDLIRCPSVTPHDAGVMDVLQSALEKLGFTVWRETFHEHGHDSVENLYARLGDAAPNFCYAGHLDVVPVGDAKDWSVDPFAGTISPLPVGEGPLHMIARGTEDMKGAIACFTAAISRFLEANKGHFNGSLSFLITLDEEGPAINGTKKMLKWMEEKGEKIDICLVGEPTNPHALGEMAKIGRRGSMNCELTVHGKQGHAAYPLLADNPVHRLVQILHRFKAEPIDEGTDYFQPSNLEISSIDVDNPAFNVIPASASARFNIRFNDSRPADELKDWLRSICETEADKFDLTMTVTGEAFHTEPNRLTDILQSVSKEITGRELELSTTGGTSDARFIKDYCPVIEFGTTGRTAHHVDENVSLETLHQLTDIYEQLLLRYFA